MSVREDECIDFCDTVVDALHAKLRARIDLDVVPSHLDMD